MDDGVLLLKLHEFDHRDEHIDDEMMIIQANLDDMNPEWSSFVADKLFAAGANDVYWIPIIMKKGRSGLMLNVLVREAKLPEMERIIFEQTTTLGLRYIRATCHRLGRQSLRVKTRWGNVTVKAGFYQGQMVQYAPEYQECAQIAEQYSVPLKEVYDEVRQCFINSRR